MVTDLNLYKHHFICIPDIKLKKNAPKDMVSF